MEIPIEKIFIGILIQAINILPKLDTLKIHSLSLDQPRNLSFEELVIFCSTENTNKKSPRKDQLAKQKSFERC